MAGGATALHRSVEGAEDEKSEGALAVDERGVKVADVVIGITASGRTPFVLGALGRAKSLGAKTILLSCNPARPQSAIVDLAIDLAVGPEILTGSTRLKAGTATKIALNIISTGRDDRAGQSAWQFDDRPPCVQCEIARSGGAPGGRPVAMRLRLGARTARSQRVEFARGGGQDRQVASRIFRTSAIVRRETKPK